MGSFLGDSILNLYCIDIVYANSYIIWLMYVMNWVPMRRYTDSWAEIKCKDERNRVQQLARIGQVN